MKIVVREHPEWDSQFPEEFCWNLVDGIKLSELGFEISKRIAADMKGDRNEVPGLRRALILIADVAEIWIHSVAK